jgi:hypothetical protein
MVTSLVAATGPLEARAVTTDMGAVAGKPAGGGMAFSR